MKRVFSVLLALAMMICSVSAMAESAWPTITLDSADYGIGSVYMADSAITTETVNPMTTAAYTEEEIAALKATESVELDDGAVLALSVNGTDTIWQYDADAAAAILSHADPLYLNAETGEVAAADGTVVAEAMIPAGEKAWATITLDSADYSIGSVYMADSAITAETVNPMTTAAYTEEEIAALKATDSIDLAAGAVLALSVNGTDNIWQYDADAAAAILSHADPLYLNAETGEVSAADGTVVAEAM